MGLPIDLYTNNNLTTPRGNIQINRWKHDISSYIEKEQFYKVPESALDETSLYWHLYSSNADQLTKFCNLDSSVPVDLVAKNCTINCSQLNLWFYYNSLSCDELYLYIDGALQVIPLDHCYINVHDIDVICDLNALLTIVINLKSNLVVIKCDLCSRIVEYPSSGKLSLNDVLFIYYDLLPKFLLVLDSQFGFVIINLQINKKCFLGQIPKQINLQNGFKILIHFPQVWLLQGSKFYYNDDLLNLNRIDWLQFDINPVLQAFEKVLKLHSITQISNLLIETNKRIFIVKLNFLIPNDLQINIIKNKLQNDNEKIIISNDKKLILSIRKYHYNLSIGLQQYSTERNIWFSLGENDLTNKLNIDETTNVKDIIFVPQMQNQYIGSIVVMQETKRNNSDTILKEYQSFNILKSSMVTMNQYDL